MAESVDELTPLKKKLDDFGAFLSEAIVCQPLHNHDMRLF